MRCPRLRALRTRVTAVAGLALTAAALLGLLVMYQIQAGSADRTIQSQLRTYAAQIGESAARGVYPRPLPGLAVDPAAQAQVVAPDGTVLAATRDLAGRTALYEFTPGSPVPVRQPAASGALPDEVSVFGEQVTAGRRRVAIITSTATSLRRQVSETFAGLLGIGVPALLLLACTTIWLVVGRSLRPVERIRGTVAAITPAGLSQRVPEPGTDDEIGQLARTMNGMLARLDDAAVRQRRFVADASHELRTPLTAIRASLEVGLAHADTAPWPDIALRAVCQSQRLEHLIAQLLVQAKSDAAQEAGRRQTVDLHALLTEIRATTLAPGISISIRVPPETVAAGHPDELSRMFRNIVDNAARYAKSSVVVSAASGPGSSVVVVEITDDGPGIPAAQRQRVFDRFVRLDPSRGHASGAAGLGLAIAREIATAHQASIELTEGGSGGVRAVVTLPAGRGAAPAARGADPGRLGPAGHLP